MVFLLKILYRGDPLGIWRSSNLKNSLPTLVVTAFEYGGLNHITLRFRCLFWFSFLGVSTNVASRVYPALDRASLYGGKALLKVSVEPTGQKVSVEPTGQKRKILHQVVHCSTSHPLQPSHQTLQFVPGREISHYESFKNHHTQ